MIDNAVNSDEDLRNNPCELLMIEISLLGSWLFDDWYVRNRTSFSPSACRLYQFPKDGITDFSMSCW